jgi:HEAT repeat protein
MAVPSAPSTTPLLRDDTVWNHWWEVNKDAYLDLKTAIHRLDDTTGADGFFLGQGQRTQSRPSLRVSDSQIGDEVVPALLRALLDEHNHHLAIGCMTALGKIGVERVEGRASEIRALLTLKLRSSNHSVRETAALFLGVLGDSEAFDLLAALARDSEVGRSAVGSTRVDVRTRSFAAYGLGLLGSDLPDREEQLRRDIVATLAQVVESDGTSTYDLNVACITSIGLVPLAGIDVPYGEGDLRALVSRTAQVQWLLEFYLDEKRRVFERAHAPTAIARLLRPRYGEAPSPELRDALEALVVPVFLEDIGRRSSVERELQQSCILALGVIADDDGDERDVRIRAALRDAPRHLADQQTRRFALTSLALAGGKEGTGVAPPDQDATDARKHLFAQLTRGKSTVRPWAGLSLGLLGYHAGPEAVDSRARAALRKQLESERNPARVGAYAIGCGLLRDEQAVPILLDHLEEFRTDEARGYIVVALGMIGNRVAIEPIRAVARASQYRPLLLQKSAVALGLLGDKSITPLLVDRLRDARSLSSQAAIASALGRIGDRRSVDALVEMIGNPQLTVTAQADATMALGIVADRADLRWNSRISEGINYRATTSTLANSEYSGILNLY